MIQHKLGKLTRTQLKQLKAVVSKCDEENIDTWLEFDHYLDFHLPGIGKQDLWDFITSNSFENNYKTFLTMIEVLLQQQNQIIKQNAEQNQIIVTTPDGKSSQTMNVIQNLVKSAKKEIMMLGYDYSEFGEIANLLLKANNQGVRIYTIGEKKFIDKVRNSLKYSWGTGIIEFYSFDREMAEEIIANNRDGEVFGYPKFHAKVVIKDQKEGLLTSANLTVSGMTCNIEIGTKIDQTASREIVTFLKDLIKDGVLVKHENWYR